MFVSWTISSTCCSVAIACFAFWTTTSWKRCSNALTQRHHRHHQQRRWPLSIATSSSSSSSSLFTSTTRGNNGNNFVESSRNSNDDQIIQSSSSSLSPSSSISPFINSRWIVQLNFGLEPGSFMPQRFPEWAASGARLCLPVELYFTDAPYNNNYNNTTINNPATVTAAATTTTVPENIRNKFDNNDGNPIPVFRVDVSPNFNSTFVSKRGEEQVSFSGGGYTMERASSLSPSSSSVLSSNIDNTNLRAATTTTTVVTKTRTRIPKPRFLLRFWIDCISGAKRNDVEVKPLTRLIGTIPIWDDPDQIARLEQELAVVTKELLVQKQEEQKNSSSNNNNSDDTTYDPMNPNATNNNNSNTSSISFLSNWLSSFFSGQKETNKNEHDCGSDNDELSLDYRQEQLERLLPLKGSVKAGNGVTTAPRGSLVMPYLVADGKSSSRDDKKQQHKYLIIGSFSMKHNSNR